MTCNSTTRFDVIAVDLKSNRVRILSTSRDEENADAIVTMAVMRRGVEEEFFGAVPAEMYKDGDFWHGNGSQTQEGDDPFDISDTELASERGYDGDM